MADLDPMKAWSGLSKNGKIAVVAGVLAISIYIWYREKQKAAAAQTNAASASAQDQSSTDTTGSTTDPNAIDPATGIPYSQESGYDSSTDPTSEYMAGYDAAQASAYGGDSGLGYSYGADTSGTDTGTGAGATTSTTPTTPDITINVPSSAPSTTTGGGAPSSPPAALAHAAPKPAPALASGAIDTTNATGKPAAKAGYTLVGTGNGGYQYIPNSKAKKGYKIYPSISKTKPSANAVGLGNGLWEVPA